VLERYGPAMSIKRGVAVAFMCSNGPTMASSNVGE
jgi:hypothetical protein